MPTEYAPLRVKEVAEERGYRITRLSDESGIPFSTLQKYWNSQIQMVSWATLSKIAETLGCNPKDLIVDED